MLEDLRGFDFVSVFATAMAEDRIATHIALAESEIACGRAKTVTADWNDWWPTIPTGNRRGNS